MFLIEMFLIKKRVFLIILYFSDFELFSFPILYLCTYIEAGVGGRGLMPECFVKGGGSKGGQKSNFYPLRSF